MNSHSSTCSSSCDHDELQMANRITRTNIINCMFPNALDWMHWSICFNSFSRSLWTRHALSHARSPTDTLRHVPTFSDTLDHPATRPDPLESSATRSQSDARTLSDRLDHSNKLILLFYDIRFLSMSKHAFSFKFAFSHILL